MRTCARFGKTSRADPLARDKNGARRHQQNFPRTRLKVPAPEELKIIERLVVTFSKLKGDVFRSPGVVFMAYPFLLTRSPFACHLHQQW